MSQLPLAYIDLRFSAHATEDPNKVLEAVKRILPTQYLDLITFKQADLQGHFGNPIILFEARIKEEEIMKAFMENFSSKLGDIEKGKLLREFDLHVGDGSLYLRLDKQAVSLGELRLGAADPIHIRIRFRKRKMEDILQFCREIGMLP
ncbi:MAG: RNA-binding domain-containing protein [Candidatus Bathyarchaeia archaeon]